MAQDTRLNAGTIYRLLLRLFPSSFRARFADEMTADFLRRLAHARCRSRRAACGAWLRTIVDLSQHAWLERRRQGHHSHSRGHLMIDDIRHALKSLRRQPSLVALVITTLAVGMGATTAVFSVASALILRDLPYREPHRLVSLGERNPTSGFSGRSNVSLPNLEDWQRASPGIEAAAAWTTGDVNLAGVTGAERVAGVRTTPAIFDVMGVPLLRGRVFTEADRAPGVRVAILSRSAWRQLMNLRDDVVGQSVVVDGEAHTIVGVAPDIPGFDDVQVWRPIVRAEPATIRRNHAYRVVARLATGATLSGLQEQLDSVAQRLEIEYPATNKGWRAVALPLQSALTEDLRPVVGLMAVAVGMLLLLASANTANLLGARAAGMRRDFAVRAALGASRMRLIRQVLTESALLGLAASALGLLIAYAATSYFTTMIAEDIALWSMPRVDSNVFGFSVALALAVSLLFGAWPALVAARQRPQQALQERPTSSPRAAADARDAGGRPGRAGFVVARRHGVVAWEPSGCAERGSRF